MTAHPSVIVVGGGWAGLSAAIKLTEAGCAVRVVESARQLGGRARRIPFNNMPVDNGQHLFIGAYRETLALLHTIGHDVNDCFLRQPLSLTSRYPDGKQVQLSAPRLPAPLHLLGALLGAKGLSWHARKQALKFGSKLFLGKVTTEPDIPLQQCLQAHQQPPTLIKAFWEPLCLAIMNTPINEASAALFIRVIKDAFFYRQQDSNLLYARKDLGELFTDPAMNFIEQHGGHVQLASKVTSLALNGSHLEGVYINNELLQAEHVILATPPYISKTLTASHSALAQLSSQLNQFSYQPIVTVYLQFPPDIALATPMLGMLNTVSQWVFDRGIYGQAGLMAVVISSSGSHMTMDNDSLADKVCQELMMLYPQWPAPESCFVVREKRATFSSHNGVNRYRPQNHTAINNLWLAGDYTQTHYPATLEGAVRSGLECAHQICRSGIN